ncbi:MAG: flavin reductase family protein [Gemmataceae bacterium]
MEQDKQLGAALGRIPSGLFILTVRNGQTETGLLASFVQQCSFDPPMVSIAIQPKRPVVSLLTEGAAFTLNLLEDGQTDMIAHFGKGFSPADDAFTGIEVERDGPGGPVLKEALAVLECQVAGRCHAGDHDLFLARIRTGRLLDEGRPMVHVRKNGFHY